MSHNEHNTTQPNPVQWPQHLWRRLARWALGVVVALLTPLVLLGAHAACLSLPPALELDRDAHLTVYDRDDQVLAHVRREDGQLHSPVALEQVSTFVVPALLAAEDKRFHWHPGVDLLAVARAALQNLSALRIVSGGSTLTQQLARNLCERPRTFAGKWDEMALALRIEASLSKEQILQAYLNRVAFGPRIVGIAAASRHFFDKPAAHLDLAEAATLAALPKGPSVYDPQRSPARVLQRRNTVLARMAKANLANAGQIRIALATPLRLERGYIAPGAHHFVRARLNDVRRRASTAFDANARQLRTTLDSRLQRRVEQILATAEPTLASHGASAAAAIVLDNASADVLAYVGAPDFYDREALGQNDGVIALRQPGSTLKPFIYAQALERLGYNVASRLPDIPLRFHTSGGDYEPRNYDGTFHGPVTLRAALANSFNVPAVVVLDRLGVARALDTLHRLGILSLRETPDHYGLALALGDGEVTLWELAAAYRALAEEGVYRAPRVSTQQPAPAATRVFARETAQLINDVLADDAARTAAFGSHSVLHLPFAVAVKTGTSKRYRDNWTVGFSSAVTVAVWVGNFDGKPMTGSSGVTGAGPLFHEIMLQAMEDRPAQALRVDRRADEASPFVSHSICAHSGLLAAPSCPQHLDEVFQPGSQPTASCDLHVSAYVDERDQTLTAAHCPGARQQVFERYPPTFHSWASSAGRPLLPSKLSPRCPQAQEIYAQLLSVQPSPSVAPRIVFPRAGARFLLDPAVSEEQQRIRIEASSHAERVRFLLDGRLLADRRAPFQVSWALSKGEHLLSAETAEGERSNPVRFVVE